MATAAKPKPGEAKRGFSLSRDAIKLDERRVELAFSSEVPYRRHFGMEVLGHDAGEVDLSRLADGTHPLLLNHDRNQQIGVVESARIDSDKKGRAMVRFGKSSMAEEVWQDVVDGIRSQVSVAYEVNEWDKIERDNGDNEWRATKWQPFEISVVSIAADTQVGIGKEKAKPMADNAKNDDSPPINAPNIDTDKIKTQIYEEESKRSGRIIDLGIQYDVMPEAQKAVSERKSVGEFVEFCLETVGKRSKEKEKREKDGNTEPPLALGSGTETRGAAQPNLSVGEYFIKSNELKAAKYKVGNRVNVRLDIPDRNTFERATLSISGASLTSIIDLPGIVVPDRRQLRVAQLFPSGPISAGSLRYVRESSYTNAATRVAEAGTKPAATIALEQATATVEKTAVVVKVTDEMFADFPATQGFVDTYLSHSVLQLEDEQLLTGTGSSQIYGVHGVTGIGSVATGSYTTVADALNGAVEAVRKNGNTEPNWFVMHPTDWHNLVRTKDSNGQYYGGGPFTGPYGNGSFTNVMSLWGIPTLVTSSQTQGQALCGNFSIGAMIFRRTGLTLESTNSNEDDFLNNLVALRAEQRMTLATWKPLAFCEVTGIPAIP